MIKRPKRGETEEDILRMQREFLSERAKNPKLQPAAKIVKVDRAPKKSLFAKSREKVQGEASSKSSTEFTTPAAKEILGEIHEKIVGDVAEPCAAPTITDIVLGDIVEKQVVAPKRHLAGGPIEAAAFPKVERVSLKITPKAGKSIFALSMEAKARSAVAGTGAGAVAPVTEVKSMECDVDAAQNLSEVFGSTSVIVEDADIASEVHGENLSLLSKMKEEEILAERKKLFDEIDPSLIALLAKRRREKVSTNATKIGLPTVAVDNEAGESEPQAMDIEFTAGATPQYALPSSNAAVEILQRSSAEHWIHFDVVETDKLEWMRDIPLQTARLKAGEKFEARFDWKGVLLPYTTEDAENGKDTGDTAAAKDERELYLHGAEPHRPGYTLQELFRLARSNVMQQRISAFGAIGGILSIYNQGFYDRVLDLPISKIFFLLRLGLDDNTPAMLEVVSKALAYLLYNETDETLLDFIYDNPGCYWQPTLHVLQTDSDVEDPTSIENLQKQMAQMQMNASTAYKANIEENEEESKMSMSDFELAETDLSDCLLRTNILQRIYFILNSVRADNSSVSSCLKILIRLARAGKDVAMHIATHDNLMSCLMENFLPGLERVDTTLPAPPFYDYPQYLCLKLLRVLISENLGIALRLTKMRLVDKLQNYLFNRDDLKDKLIKVQVECLRIVRCLLLLQVDSALYRKFLPAFRYMLEWHYNHVIYEEGGPFLIRQHAAALLAAITAGSVCLEASALLGDLLHDCCCSWFHRATRSGVKEFSQATLLSACLHAVAWSMHHNDAERFRNFHGKYLCDFVASDAFAESVRSLVAASIILRQSNDRRNVHPPLPNVGAVLMHRHGPQLIIPQTYSVFLLSSLWRLLELHRKQPTAQQQRVLLDALIRPPVVEPLVQYLRLVATKANRYLATNFYAKTELKLIFQLLCFEGFSVYFEPAQMLQLVYNFLCCLTAEHIPEIEQLFERVIFNRKYMQRIEAGTLKCWQDACVDMVHAHYIVVPPTELRLSMPFSQPPILPTDWPYFQLKIILQNYIANVQQKRAEQFSERDVLHMTLTFVAQLEECNPELQIVSPTEKLMYLMICFMGPHSEFLAEDVRPLLRQHLLRFYAQCSAHTFQFDANYAGKCKFENLYALFVDHFQAASYGDELFGSLLLVPLAQKYDNKWRRRVWSDYASALRFLNCDESLLIGGLHAYLDPPEEEESLLRAYATALKTDQVRPGIVPYIIAKHHIDMYKERCGNKVV